MSPAPAPAAGSMEALGVALEALAERITGDLPDGAPGKLHTSLWWDPALPLPCAYWWCPRGTPTEDSKRLCGGDIEELELVLSIATRPGKHAGADLARLTPLCDIARPLLGHACEHARDELGGVKSARRGGFRLARDRFGNAEAIVAEFPIHVRLHTSY